MENPIIAQYRKWNEFGRLVDMDFEIPEPGKIIYRVKIQEKHLATNVTAHGGLLASLMDACLGVCALGLSSEEMKLVSTVSMNMQFLMPLRLHDEIEAHGAVQRKGTKIYFTEARVYNQREELVATGNAILNAYPFDKILSE